MPVDLLPRKTRAQAAALLPATLLDHSLNWLAVVLGVGLCMWVVNYGVTLPF
jgi:hypothetical protein